MRRRGTQRRSTTTLRSRSTSSANTRPRDRCSRSFASASPANAELPYRVEFSLGQSLFLSGDRGEAEKVWRSLIGTAEQEADPRGLGQAALALAGLPTICAQDGRVDEAEALVRRALRDLPEIGRTAADSMLRAAQKLAGVLDAKGDLDGAAALFRELLAEAERIYGADHTLVLELAVNLAAVDWRNGAKDAARERLLELVAAGEAAGFGDSLRWIAPYANLGKMFWSEGDLETGASYYRKAIDLRERMSPGSDITLSGFYHDLARIRLNQRRNEESLELLRTSVRIQTEALGPLHPKVLPRRVDLASAEFSIGKNPDIALGHLREVDDHLMEALGIEHFAKTFSQEPFTAVLVSMGEFDEARARFDRFVERAAASPDPSRWQAAIERLRRELAR